MSPGRSVGSPERLDAREPEPVLAVARAAVAHLVAIGEGIVEVGVARAVLRDGGVDLAAGEHHGLGRRAERLAQLGRRRAGMALQREIAAVAGPHAIDRAVAEAAGFAGRPLIAEQAKRIGERAGRGMGSGACRRKPPNSASNRPCAEAGWTDPARQSVNAVSRTPPTRRIDLRSAIATVVSLRPEQTLAAAYLSTRHCKNSCRALSLVAAATGWVSNSFQSSAQE